MAITDDVELRDQETAEWRTAKRMSTKREIVTGYFAGTPNAAAYQSKNLISNAELRGGTFYLTHVMSYAQGGNDIIETHDGETGGGDPYSGGFIVTGPGLTPQYVTLPSPIPHSTGFSLYGFGSNNGSRCHFHYKGYIDRGE